MEVGLVTQFDPQHQSGVITTPDGQQLAFRYEQGQNMLYGNNLVTPQFSGQHEQPEGFTLKLPRAGDPVVFERTAAGDVRSTLH